MGKSLRTQFIDYMTLNRYSPWTIKNYISVMKQLAKYHNKSPDLITQEEIQEQSIKRSTIIGHRRITLYN